MKLTISKEILVEQLSHVVGAIDKKHTSKILENIFIRAIENKLQLVGTDLEIEMSAEIDMTADTLGQITASAQKFFDICKSLPKDSLILLETDDKQRLHIKGGRSRFELATLPADEYPLLDDIPIKQEFTVPEKTLKNILDKVSFSMANQDVRYYLNGMLLVFSKNTIIAVTTDGHRLAITKNTEPNDSIIELEQKIIVPRKGILELTRLLDSSSELPITLQLSENHIRVNKDQIRFTSKLIDGKYPDYQAAIPANCEYSIELDREQFSDTLARVSILSNETFKGIKIKIYDGTMYIQSNNPDNESAEEEIDVDYSGDVFEISFNVTYLLEAINHLEGDTIIFELFTADTSAVLYSSADIDTQYIVMPVRL